MSKTMLLYKDLLTEIDILEFNEKCLAKEYQNIRKSLVVVPKGFLNGTIVIQSNYKTFLTFVDWDDLDLMWPAVLRMTLEFLENGQEGTTEHFSNGLELGIKLIQPIKDKKVLF
ncbi:hypothetical protein [Shouchella miscanthi]|uniref:hypothetical protein n=1 Tax=Shouchella miscanthi TaxID=2598861 RepID=UPI0011A881B8|nr:hypothetical protein [Shouchella miscanthi]